jgi:hypothetical protein
VKLLMAVLLAGMAGQAETKTRNLILITSDGLRWQELFGGIDAALMNEKAAGMARAAGLRRELWRESPEERRSVLMPFFWATLAPRGVVLGNVRKNSSVAVTNAFRVSYPGYSEILTGRSQDAAIRNNDSIRNPTATVLEFLKKKLALSRNQVALFGSWGVFDFIGESQQGSILINAGYREASGTARMKELSALQFDARTPWDEVRHDFVTVEMALEHLRAEKPRVMHIAFGESDDWAHDRRYDRVLASIQYFDQALRKVWEFVENSPDYRGRTSLVITSDHGRGSTLEDWHGHGAKIAGAEQIWAAVLGPDTPARGEAANTAPAFQRDIAPTMLDLLGIDYREYEGVAGKPIPLARAPETPGRR